jgi:hypothetical protein
MDPDPGEGHHDDQRRDRNQGPPPLPGRSLERDGIEV